MATFFTVTVQGRPVQVPFNDGIHNIDITSSSIRPTTIKVIPNGQPASQPIIVDQTHDEVLRLMHEARQH
jgi:hypothetical protein